jgi:hypothetical protein
MKHEKPLGKRGFTGKNLLGTLNQFLILTLTQVSNLCKKTLHPSELARIGGKNVGSI